MAPQNTLAFHAFCSAFCSFSPAFPAFLDHPPSAVYFPFLLSPYAFLSTTTTQTTDMHPQPSHMCGLACPCNSAMAHHRRTEIDACSENRDWERLREIRESIVNRAPIYVTPSLVSQTQPQPQSQPHLRSQPVSQSAYYQAARPQTPPTYPMAPYSQTSYGALSGLRSQNPPAHSYQATHNGLAARSRPNAGLNLPTIAYKPSPFYDPKYQIGDVRTLEGEFKASPSSPVPLRYID